MSLVHAVVTMNAYLSAEAVITVNAHEQLFVDVEQISLYLTNDPDFEPSDNH